MSTVLHPPKKNGDAYFLALKPGRVEETPPVQWTADGWTLSSDVEERTAFATWATQTRDILLGELLSHGNWFSRPPQRALLDPLFAPWVALAPVRLTCSGPPAIAESSAKATWSLKGLRMTGAAIEPVFEVATITPDLDQISLFGGSDTESDVEIEEFVAAPAAPATAPAAPASAPASATGGAATTEGDLTEVSPEDFVCDSESPPVILTTVDPRLEARKRIAKERIREARIKAQIAQEFARREIARYQRQFGPDVLPSDSDSGSEGTDSGSDETDL